MSGLFSQTIYLERRSWRTSPEIGSTRTGASFTGAGRSDDHSHLAWCHWLGQPFLRHKMMSNMPTGSIAASVMGREMISASANLIFINFAKEVSFSVIYFKK
jgi:hypothetical protein